MQSVSQTFPRPRAASCLRQIAWPEWLPPLGLFLLNAVIVKRLWTLEYSQYMGSIEAAFIAIARWIQSHGADLTWYPLWYGGVPFQDTYPPLLHATVALAAAVFRLSPALAYHAVTAFTYSLAPVTLYLFCVRLSGSRLLSAAAALMYSLVSPSAFLIPVVRHDMGGLWNDRRLQALLPYGEGPHTTAITLIPLALLLMDRAVERLTPWRLFFAALCSAAVVCTNWIGAMAFGMGVAVLLVTRLPGARGVLAAGSVALLAYAVACRWIPPSTIHDMQAATRFVGGDYRNVHHTMLAAAAVAAVVIALLKIFFLRTRTGAAVQFFSFYALLMAGITLGWEWARVAILPQPSRYHLEMDLALCALAVFVAGPIFLHLRGKARVIAAALLTVACAFQTFHLIRNARGMIRPIAIESTIEYQTAKWLQLHVPAGRRVMVPGTVSFWLNAFSDTEQFGGGNDNGTLDPVYFAVSYQLYSGQNAGAAGPDVARTWLKAYGVSAIGVQGPRSREVFHPLQSIERFAAYPVLWRNGGDAVCAVPGRSASLAHIIPAGAIVASRPAGGLDIEPVRAYVAALDDPGLPEAQFEWRGTHDAIVHTNMNAGQILSVQVSFHPGWHASANGSPARIQRDGLGQMLVNAPCNGPCEVHLYYDGGAEMTMVRWVSGLAFVGSLAWCLLGTRVVRALRQQQSEDTERETAPRKPVA